MDCSIVPRSSIHFFKPGGTNLQLCSIEIKQYVLNVKQNSYHIYGNTFIIYKCFYNVKKWKIKIVFTCTISVDILWRYGVNLFVCSFCEDIGWICLFVLSSFFSFYTCWFFSDEFICLEIPKPIIIKVLSQHQSEFYIFKIECIIYSFITLLSPSLLA